MLVSHNELLEDYPWVYGVKTGWTDGAVYCIAAAGLWRGHHIWSRCSASPSYARGAGGKIGYEIHAWHWLTSHL